MRTVAFTNMGRQFKNTLPDYKPGGGAGIDRSKIVRHLKHTLDVVTADEDARRKPSIYTGGSGIAYSLWHVLQVPDVASLLPNASSLAPMSVDFSTKALQQHYRRPSGAPWSLLFGEAGAHLVAALSHSTAACLDPGAACDLHAASFRHVQNFLHYSEIAASPACHEDEFIYGRAGYLMGCLILNDYFTFGVPREFEEGKDFEPCPSPDNPVAIPGRIVETLARVLIISGRRQAASLPHTRDFATPLWWEWHGFAYLGAAHGSMGILYVLLHVPQEFLDPTPDSLSWIKGTIDYIATLECDETGIKGPGGEFPRRMGPTRDKEPLMHWCHGAVGAVFLFTQAEKVLGGDGRYMEVALRAGEAVWRRGLLRKGPGVCHGVSGSAYAFLRLFKETKDEKWLYRAGQFADFMSSNEFLKESRTPDHPHSLFEGWAAAACVYADLLRPEGARFPLFELNSRGVVMRV